MKHQIKRWMSLMGGINLIGITLNGISVTSISMVGLLGCAEPNSSVTRSTGDDAFEVGLKAAKNHLRPGEALPILVTVEPVSGQLTVTLRDTIDFVANQGSVSPTRLVFTFVGLDDSLSGGVTTIYREWVTFTLDSRAQATDQADVHALFRDLDTTLKIRVVED